MVRNILFTMIARQSSTFALFKNVPSAVEQKYIINIQTVKGKPFKSENIIMSYEHEMLVKEFNNLFYVSCFAQSYYQRSLLKSCPSCFTFM